MENHISHLRTWFMSGAYAVVLLAGLISAASAETRTAILVPGALETQRLAQAVYDGTLGYLTRIESQKTVELVDLSINRTVMRLETPVDILPSHRGWVNNLLDRPVTDLQAFVSAAFRNGKQAPLVDVPHHTGFPQALNQLADRAGTIDTAVFVTSARRTDARSASQDTVSLVPSHGLLDLPSTETVYGTADLKGILGGMDIYVCIADDAYVHPRQDPLLREFYFLKIKEMGGQLRHWSDNIEECLRQAQEGISGSLPQMQRDPEQDTPAFLEITDDGWKVARYLEGHEPPVEKPLSPEMKEKLALLEELEIPQDATDEVKEAIISGKLRPVVAWISDFDATDGDVLRLHYGHTYIDVPLSSDPYRAVLLLDLEDSAKISGVIDGAGGGVTALVQSEDKQQSLKVSLEPGQTRDVPFLK